MAELRSVRRRVGGGGSTTEQRLTNGSRLYGRLEPADGNGPSSSGYCPQADLACLESRFSCVGRHKSIV